MYTETNNKAKEYQQEFGRFREQILSFSSHLPEYRIECLFETLKDWSLCWKLSEIENWFSNLRSSCPMTIEEIPIKIMKNWNIDPETGNIYHASGGFFKIHGIRTSFINNREVENGWDQPIVTQIGLDGGILGMIRKRINGIPHYLIEAKLEPGNYQGYQLSPTLQATFSNLKQVHGGRRPLFAEYFETPAEQGAEVLYDAWLSEDGGRFFKKRNRGMLIEVHSDKEINVCENRFRWMSLFQIKELLLRDGWVNPHIRGIISHI